MEDFYEQNNNIQNHDLFKNIDENESLLSNSFYEYDITIKQEVLGEVCANFMSQIMLIIKQNQINMSDKNNQYVLLYSKLMDIKEELIGEYYSTDKQLEEIQLFFSSISLN
jgi:hypothetical protein